MRKRNKKNWLESLSMFGWGLSTLIYLTEWDLTGHLLRKNKSLCIVLVL